MFKFVHLALCSLLFASNAYAYHLDDHERIMRQAYAEFTKCFPQVAQKISVDDLVQGDLDEDQNLIVKELFYSHFYNPLKKINQRWRKGSDGRLTDLSPKLQQCRTSGGAWDADMAHNLGYAIHHFQDMTVPAHVIPVMHTMNDGFEVYALTEDISSGWSCADISSSYIDDLLAVLKSTALTTMSAVDGYSVEAATAGGTQAVVVKGVDFWRQSNDDSFGSYSDLGNVFGQGNIQISQGSAQVQDQAYRDFKHQQMQSAVRATLQGLVWAFH